MPEPKPIQSCETPPPKNAGRLAAVLGTTLGAVLLYVGVPKEESSRVVDARVQTDGSIKVRNVSGKLYLKSYLDIVGVPTACDGITKGVRLNQTYTEEQCNQLLEQELIAHSAPVIKCIPGLYGKPYQIAAGVDLAYNVGTGGVCKSSIARLWNQGKWLDGCRRLPLFNKAGGRPNKGLTHRRARAEQVCITGLVPGATPENLSSRIKKVS